MLNNVINYVIIFALVRYNRQHYRLKRIILIQNKYKVNTFLNNMNINALYN